MPSQWNTVPFSGAPVFSEARGSLRPWRNLATCNQVWVDYCTAFHDRCKQFCASNPSHEICCALERIPVTTTTSPAGFLAQAYPESTAGNVNTELYAGLIAAAIACATVCILLGICACLYVWRNVQPNARVSPTHDDSSSACPSVRVEAPKVPKLAVREFTSLRETAGIEGTGTPKIGECQSPRLSSASTRASSHTPSASLDVEGQTSSRAASVGPSCGTRSASPDGDGQTSSRVDSVTPSGSARSREAPSCLSAGSSQCEYSARALDIARTSSVSEASTLRIQGLPTVVPRGLCPPRTQPRRPH